MLQHKRIGGGLVYLFFETKNGVDKCENVDIKIIKTV